MKRSRFLLFGVVLATHLLLIAVIAQLRTSRSAPLGHERVLMLAQLERPLPPQPRRPPPRPRLRTPVPDDMPMPPPPPPAPPQDFYGCATTSAVQTALADDPRVQQVLATVPATARSVSNTFTVWDGDWADVATPGQFDALRIVLGEALSAQPPECLDQPMIGPRLFVVVQQSDAVATSLVIGSGRWQWRDVTRTESSVRNGERNDQAAPQASIGSHRSQ